MNNVNYRTEKEGGGLGYMLKLINSFIFVKFHICRLIALIILLDVLVSNLEA